MAFHSSTELLAWLSQNLFLNPQQVDELRAWVAGSPDLHAFCKELLRRDWLTPFQVRHILKRGGETLIIGANRLHSRVGEGAMGQVYKAWNVRLGRMVAIKMLHAERALSGKAMDRFRREMQTAAALDHPNIVLLRDADESNHVPYLVMDYFDGIDLAAKVRAEGPQPIPQATEYIRQAAIGLQHAFERGIVHRDIKPSNILLVKTSTGGVIVKILDFGLAKFERDEDGVQPLTQAGRLIGTVDYISPEQAMDAHNADTRADIYSLGCALFYILTALPPFPGNSQLEKLTARIQGEPPRLREHLPEAPADLEAVLLKMLARDPDNRYQTPSEVAVALAPFCDDGPLAIPDIPSATTSAGSTDIPLAHLVPPTLVADDPTQAELGFGSHSTDGPGFAKEARARVLSRRVDAVDAVPILRRPPVAIGVGALILLLLSLAAYVIMQPKGTTVEPIRGSMALSLESPPDKIWAWNDRKPIIVKVIRQDFTGPVTLAVDNCPIWLDYRPATIAAARNEGQLMALIRFQADEGRFTMRIVATADGSQPAYIDYPMEIVSMRIPASKKEAPPGDKE